MSDVSFDAFIANPALYIEPPREPAAGEIVAWVKRRIEHGAWVTCGVSPAHYYCAENKTLCLLTIPSWEHLLPSKQGGKPCPICAALHKAGVRTLDEAIAVEARRATLAAQGAA